jgi:hypothetical protein
MIPTNKNFSLFPSLNKNIKKANYLFDQLQAIQSIKSASITDADKRSYFRYFFVVIDSLLKVLPQIKNAAYKNQIINRNEEAEFKRLIKVVETSYNGTYDTIRDKLSAHQQQLPLDQTLSWWADIDSITIEVLGDDIDAIYDFMASKRFCNGNKLNLLPHPSDFTSEKKITFNAGRFGMGIAGAVSIIPGHEVQEKSVMAMSAIDFLKKDLWLTYVFDDPKSEHYTHVNNIGWFLAIIDFTSLLDCIYDDIKEKSLATIWRENNIKGYQTLMQIPRDINLESEIRLVRNKIAAHLDDKKELTDSLHIYYKLDAQKFYSYIISFVNSFLTSCKEDIRNAHMLAHDVELNGVIGLAKDESIKSFDQ